MGRRPHQPADRARWFAKADVALRSNKAASVGPPIVEGLLFCGTHISTFGASCIERSTIEAYLATEYRICGHWPLVLRIGVASDQLSELYRRCAVESAAVLTAWNPWSEPISGDENRAAQRRLCSELDQMRLKHQPARGVDPTGDWPAEDSRLVLGLDRATANSLAAKFKQNGFVWVSPRAVPKLILLR